MKKRKSFKDRNERTPKRRESGVLGRKDGWIYGLHAVHAALRNPARVHHRLLATEKVADELSELAREIDMPPLEIVKRDDIDAVLPRDSVHQGVALLTAPLEEVALDDICAEAASADHAIVVVLDRVTDPHNVGAVLRSAAVFGAAGVVVSERGATEATGCNSASAWRATSRSPQVVDQRNTQRSPFMATDRQPSPLAPQPTVKATPRATRCS